MNNFSAIIFFPALLLAGCITTDGNGKPIPHEAAKPKVAPFDRVVSDATLDGSRIVASGKPPLAFLYPGVGRLSVRDVDAGSIVFTVELPDRPENEVRTLISLTVDGKLTGSVARPDGTTASTEIAGVNKSHAFVITYLPGVTSPR